MSNNLLVKSTIYTAIALSMAACSDVDTGYAPGYGSTKGKQVAFSDDAINVTFDEETGKQTIDLLQGSTVDGSPLTTESGNIFIKNIAFVEPDGFVTPQADSNSVSNHRISPFTVEGTSLIVDTDLFAESLRQCDDSDTRGAKDADGNTIGDGFLDFPSTVTYQVSFEVDNGYEGEPAIRQLTITVDAINDPVTEVVASMLELPAGGNAQFVASTLPAYACNSNLTYSVADTSKATVNDSGLVTGTGVGSTTITIASVENPELTTTADINVTAAFSLAFANEDLDPVLGTPTGEKMVPTCVAAGVDVQPAVINHTLNGEYNYSWTSSNGADMPVDGSVKHGFGAFGKVNVGATTSSQSTITANLESGDTGATSISEIASKSVVLTSVKNEMCEPGESLHAAGFNTDFSMDAAGAPYKGNMAAVMASTDSVTDGGTSVQITAGTGMGSLDGVTTTYTRIAQEVWNKQRQWYSWNYGRGLESVGRTYKFSVWAKLESVPAEPVTLRQAIVPWVFDGELDTTASGFNQRYVEGGAAIFTAKLESTTDWQYIEFTYDSTGERAFTIPETWNVVTDVFNLWEVFGLAEGETILLDDYGVVRTDEM